MGLIKYAVKMGSGVVIYIPSFIKFGSGIQKLIMGIKRHTDSMTIVQTYICFFLNKENGLKNGSYESRKTCWKKSCIYCIVSKSSI
jgi:hypothetical protein